MPSYPKMPARIELPRCHPQEATHRRKVQYGAFFKFGVQFYVGGGGDKNGGGDGGGQKQVPSAKS